MTIRELAETNQSIFDIDVTIRNNGLLQHKYRFGGGASYQPGDYDFFGKLENHVTVDNTKINSLEINREYFELKLSRIPKKYQPLLDREVFSWNLNNAYRDRDCRYDGARKLDVTVDDGRLMAPIRESTGDKENQIDGQISMNL